MKPNETQWLPETTGAKWIFPSRPEDTVNQLVDFHQTFDCTSTGTAELRISADTDFVVWLNGTLIGYGQYSDYPDQKTFESFSLANAILQGKNSLAVTVFYNGRTSSVYRRGQAGLLFEVTVNDTPLAVSGTDTLCRANPCYHSGPIATVSGQLFYTFGYDARGGDDANLADYTPGDDWATIQEHEATFPEDRSSLMSRPVPRLVEDGLTACRLQAAGVFRRDITLAEQHVNAKAVKQTPAGLLMSDETVVSPAWQMQHDHLSSRSSFDIFGCPLGTELTDSDEGLTADPDHYAEGEGVYIVIDMGQQEVGHLDFDLDVPEGAILDIGYGEHLDDLRVRTCVGGRNFAARYISRGGRQQFIHHFQRWAGRYLAVHSSDPNLTIHRVNLQRRTYPVTVPSSLSTGNDLHTRILTVAQRTLHLCMHEHYEDTPWREQALYANDARTQALCGYYAFGETTFPRSSFSLLGRGLRDDGFLHLTAPAMPGLTIPSFTFCWMLAVRDHYLYSGDDSLAKAFLPQIRTMLKDFLDERRDGLLPLRRKKGIWHFYDWSGMSGYSDADFDAGLEADAPLNCFLVMAIDAAQEMMTWLGEEADATFTDAAKDLRTTIADRFWNAEEGIFRTHEYATTTTQLTQALAVLAGVGTDAQRESALTQMAAPDSGLIEPGLSQTLYTFSALMTRKALFGEHVLKSIERTWGIMLNAGATTFWETIKGGADFHNAGSLCHAWSAVPVYIYYHDLVGIRPLEPGFKRFAVDPIPQCLPACSGTIPVPGSSIQLTWNHVDGKVHYQLHKPSTCDHALRGPEETFTIIEH